MGEVTGTEQAHPLALRPPGKVLQLEIPAAGTGVLGMNVEVGDPGFKLDWWLD
jgi:hypothetical protein